MITFHKLILFLHIFPYILDPKLKEQTSAAGSFPHFLSDRHETFAIFYGLIK